VKYYILNPDRTIRAIDTTNPDGSLNEDALREWGRWFETADRRVAWTQFDDGSELSTVFLGIDHNFFGDPPILFESMLFSATKDDAFGTDMQQDRYATWTEAMEGHERMARERGHIVTTMKFIADNAVLHDATAEAIAKAKAPRE
jgi:hypothetical protein